MRRRRAVPVMTAEDERRCATQGAQAAARMARFDALDPRLQAIINEHGTAPVDAAWNLGLRGERLVWGAEQFVAQMTGQPGA